MRMVLVALTLVLASPVSAQGIPGIPPERQEKAKILGLAYYESLFLNTCDKLLPGTPQFRTAIDALVKAATDLENSFSDEEMMAIRVHIVKGFEKIDLILKTNPQAFVECSQAAQLAGAQIATGMFNNR